MRRSSGEEACGWTHGSVHEVLHITISMEQRIATMIERHQTIRLNDSVVVFGYSSAATMGL